MKKKINIHLLGIATLAILSTLILVSAVYYDLLKKQVFYDLKCYAHMLNIVDEQMSLEKNNYGAGMNELRITIVNPDGSVKYDSEADVGTMGNHKNRPEIFQAMKDGKGEDVRYSQTLRTSTFYYAEKLDDGSVLRVGKETSSVYAAFTNVLPIFAVIVILLFVICIICAYLITKSLVSPIEDMADNLNKSDIQPKYKELIPFVNAIQKQHRDIIQVSQMRQEFTANVSHELKTPLASISGYSELIETGVASGDDVIHFAHEIHQNTNRLLVLINDIIRLSQLDSVDFQIELEDVNLYEVAQDCVDMLYMNASQHNVELNFTGDEVVIRGNGSMLEEALYNLIDNAIRYNKENGKVTVRVEEDSKEVRFIVEDTGIGISQEDKERIFERFYRVDKSRSKQTGGTGLGLAIVKHIVLKHDAKIEVESELGQGTRTTIRFPKDNKI